MNYSAEIKEQLLSQKTEKKNRLAFLSALLRTCGVIRRSGSATEIMIVSSNPEICELTARLATEFFSEEFGAALKGSGKDTVVYGDVAGMLIRCGIMRTDEEAALGFVEGIDSSLLRSEGDKLAYIKGAYLGAGSFSVSSWQLEITVNEERLAGQLCELIGGLGIKAHLIKRNLRYAVYIKKQDDICDFLSHIGAVKVMLALSEVLVGRKTRRDVAKRHNLELSNMDRTINAGVEQCEAIKKIERTMGISSLSPKLVEVALLRLKDSTITYEEIAAQLQVSKGSVKYRFKKILEAAEKIPSGRKDSE